MYEIYHKGRYTNRSVIQNNIKLLYLYEHKISITTHYKIGVKIRKGHK